MRSTAARTYLRESGSKPSNDTKKDFMRKCDLAQLTVKPFAGGGLVVAVAEDGQPRVIALGGAGRVGHGPTLTLYLSSAWDRLPDALTVNLLSPGQRLRPLHSPVVAGAAGDAGIRLEPGESVRVQRIADARMVFECRVLAQGSIQGLDGYSRVLVAEVLAAYQRWPRGCAI